MSHDPLSIALIEDDPIMGESLNQCLELEGYRVAWWRTGREALIALGTAAPDLVICDIRLPDISGEDVFRRVAADPEAPPFLFMTAFGQIDQAVALMRAGAGDYLTKPFEIDDLLVRARALVTRNPSGHEGVLGVSSSMRDIETLLRRIARHPAPVLFSGETGVGKEVCARLLHEQSAAMGEPFVAVNCAAIPGNLLESEVFGHEKGAFTGAITRHLGYAERARRGTLFLDEVGELPPALQAKMLRLIEERCFYRLGGEAVIPFRARVVCATNRDLSAEVAAGRFREDLLYRINVVTVDVPPLRERRDDIRWLLTRFFAQITRDAGTTLRGISSLAEEAAVAHAWPGNARELRNRLARAVALAGGEWLMPGDLFPERRRQMGAGGEPVQPLSVAREEAEKREIERALRHTDGQIGEAGKLLGVSRTTLWERMRRFGIETEGEG
jgi:two-component system, NtrC family, response regulator HydG